MILLNPAGTAEKLEVVIATAADIDTLAEGTESADNPITPSSNMTAFAQVANRTTAATHELCAGPASTGDVRTVQRVSIFNKDTADSSDVTVQKDVGGTKYVLAKANLAPGEALRYSEDAVDWFETVAAVGAGPVYNQSVAAQSPATSDTYVTNSNLLVGGRLKAGTRFQWRIHMSKTAAGAAAPSVIIRVGTAGAIGDTARVTMTGPSQTAVVDEAVLLVEAVIRTYGTTGVLQGNMGIQHSAAVAAGFGEMFDAITSGTFDMTLAALQFGISVIPNTSAAWTITQVQAQAENLA